MSNYKKNSFSPNNAGKMTECSAPECEGLLLQNCPEMIFYFDGQLRFLSCSKACLPLLCGQEQGLLVGTPFREVFSVFGEWADKAYAALAGVLSSKEPIIYEDAIPLHEDSAMEAQLSMAPVLDISGENNGAMMVIKDIAELVDMRRKAEEAIVSKNSFLSNMSHEIRTPINAIKGLSELLALTELSATQSNYVMNIISSTNSLLSLINDVLDFSKIDKDEIDFIEGEYSPAGLVSEVSNLMSLRAAGKGLKLFMEVSPELPAKLQGDDVRIKQIMVNILSNAIKYTPAGRVVFRLHGEPMEDGRLWLVCTIEDTGVGIREEDISRLFKPFSRADIQANRNVMGTGLGLTISRRLAEGMGGSISVSSVFGKGSVFTVRLPQGIVGEEPLVRMEDLVAKNVLLLAGASETRYIGDMLDTIKVKHATAASEKDVQALKAPSFTHCIYEDGIDRDAVLRLRKKMPECVFAIVKDMRYAMDRAEEYDAVLFLPLLITDIAKVLLKEPGRQGGEAGEKSIDTFALVNVNALVVDDNEINLLVSGEILRSYKAQVTCAESGKEALELCAETVYDIIFMDHMMPEMDGMETTTEIRHREGPNRNTPIVALTANVAEDVPDCYLENGMNDYIPKPLEISDLSRVLLRWLPAEKIVSLQSALHTGKGHEVGGDMEKMIAAMDAFGMYVSDVMREIGNDYGLYLSRMEKIRTELSPLVATLRQEVAAQGWDAFAADIGALATMIHDVGARDCSGRARKLNRAALEQNAEYIQSDFFSLMDNMYMLQKKMEVAVPFARGEIAKDVPFGDKAYCYNLLKDLRVALRKGDLDAAEGLMESLSCYSLDHDLDMILLKIKEKLATQEFQQALPICDSALKHTEETLQQ